MEVERRGGVGAARELKVAFDLLLLLLQSFEPTVLRGDTLYYLLLEDVGVADHIAFLNFLPIIVSISSVIEVLIDSVAGEVVADRHFAVGSSAIYPRTDLLVLTHRKGHVPVILAIQFVQSLLLIRFPVLLLGDQFLHRPAAQRRRVEGDDLRLRVGTISVQLDFGGLEG